MNTPVTEGTPAFTSLMFRLLCEQLEHLKSTHGFLLKYLTGMLQLEQIFT